MTRPGLGAWIVILALPAAAVGLRAWIDAEHAERKERPERELSASAAGTAWWTGTGEVDGIGRVLARVRALHADPARQSFDAERLRARDARYAAEPYWVEIELLAPTDAEGQAAMSIPRIDPRELRIEDERGVALANPSAGTAAQAARAPGAVDPLSSLLSPSRPLAPGEHASFVLFGRAPEAGARLVLAAGDAGVERVLELTISTENSSAEDLPIARVDRRTPTERGQ